MKPKTGYLLLLPVALLFLAVTIFALQGHKAHAQNPCAGKASVTSMAQAQQIWLIFAKYGVFRDGPLRFSDSIVREMTTPSFRATLDPRHPSQSIIPWPVPISRTRVMTEAVIHPCSATAHILLTSQRVGSTLFNLQMTRHAPDHWRVDYWGSSAGSRLPKN